MLKILFILLASLSLPECLLAFEVNRLQTGDILSGDGIAAYCGTQTSCACNEGETLFAESTTARCSTKINGCDLLAEHKGNIQNIGLVSNDFSNNYDVIITTGSAKPVCEANTTTVTVQPIFVHDLQTTSMFWNINWMTRFRDDIKLAVYEDTKVKMNFKRHWSGLFLKFYINCDGQNVGCVGIKFDGMKSYPITNDVIDEVLGPTQPPSPSSSSSELITPSSMTSSKSMSIEPSTSFISATTSIQPSKSVQISSVTTVLSTPKSTEVNSLSPTPSSSVTSGSLTTVVALEPTRSTASVQQSTLVNPGAIKTDDDDDIGLYVGLGVAIFVLLLILIIIFLICRRKKQKKLPVNIDEGIQDTKPRPHASIKYLNSNAGGSITSPPSILNKRYSLSEDNINPLFDDDLPEKQQASSPKIKVERIKSNSRQGSMRSNEFTPDPTYDNPAFTRDDYYGDAPPTFRRDDDRPDYDDEYNDGDFSYHITPDDQTPSYRGFQQPNAQDFNKSFYGADEPYSKVADGLDDIPFEEDEDEDYSPQFHYGTVEKVNRHDLETIVESPRSTTASDLI